MSRIDIDELKRKRLLDIIRRVVANPGNAKEVADKLAEDWFPLMQVNSKGEFEFVIGTIA